MAESLIPHPVMNLVFFLEAPQNGNGVGDIGFIDHHRLKTTFQGGILFDILAILVDGGGPHTERRDPLARAGLSILEASMAPSEAPAPTRVCNSSMNIMI